MELSSSEFNDYPLSDPGPYDCPICYRRQIQPLALMDTWGCSSCQHIFTLNLQQQSIQVIDTAQPFTWVWNGRRWRSPVLGDRPVRLVIGVLGLVLLVFPSLLVGLSAYIFPPLEGSQGAWIPWAWVGLTFLTHSLLVGWLIGETYQMAPYIAWKLRLQNLWMRSFS